MAFGQIFLKNVECSKKLPIVTREIVSLRKFNPLNWRGSVTGLLATYTSRQFSPALDAMAASPSLLNSILELVLR